MHIWMVLHSLIQIIAIVNSLCVTWSMCSNRYKSVFNRYYKRIMEPLVVILGATGTGKSKLAIELAEKFSGEIISADSMQIYKGLDILTNKVTIEEQSTVKHHMLDFVNPLNDTCTVVEFRDSVLPIIKCLHEDKILPIIVGGTHYYVESILWKVLVQTGGNFDKFSREIYASNVDASCQHNNNSSLPAMELCNETSEKKVDCKKCVELAHCKDDKPGFQEHSNPKSNINNLRLNDLCSESSFDITSSVSKLVQSEINQCVEDKKEIGDQHSIYNDISKEELLRRLEEIDPEISSRYHPNDRRKIIRSLEVWHQTGVRHSEHLRRQTEEVGGADLGGGVRFKNAVVLWITCEKDNLNKRLDGRVDEMLQRGLIEELSHFHASCNIPALKGESAEGTFSSLCKDDVGEHYQKGIFQCIGLKEFHEYLLLDDDERNSENGTKLKQKCIELMKLRTRQYAKRQEKWMKNRFLIRNREKIPVYALDGNDISSWNENVFIPAAEILRCLLKGDSPLQKPVTISVDNNVDTGDKTRHFCDTCQRIFIGNSQWEQHLKSKKHRIVVEKIRNMSENLQNNTKRSLDKEDKLVSKIQKL